LYKKEIIGILGIVATLLTAGILYWLQLEEPANNPLPTTGLSLVRSIVVQPPNGVQGESRQWLRDEHKVRPLIDVESGLEISEAPLGIFGFSSGVSIAFDGSLILSRSRSRPEFELHKLVDGSVYFVGFVGVESAALLRRDVWPGAVSFPFYSRAWDDAEEIVALPLDDDRIRKRYRSIELDDRSRMYLLDITID